MHQRKNLVAAFAFAIPLTLACDSQYPDDESELREDNLPAAEASAQLDDVLASPDENPDVEDAEGDAYGFAEVTEFPDPAPVDPIEDLMDAPDVAAAPSCWRYATSTQVLTSGSAGATNISCNAGQTMTGGGFSTDDSGDLIVYASYPPDAATWRAGFRNTGPGIGGYRVWVRCCQL